jgi:hypothetical protein
MRNVTSNPWFHASALAASNLGIAMLTMNDTNHALVTGGLTSAASILAALVSNSIQRNSDSEDALAELATSRSIHTRIADLLETIILTEKQDPYDTATETIAGLTKRRWLELQRNGTENLRENSVFPIENFVTQLLNPTEQHLLIEDWIIIIEGAETLSPEPIIDELRRHQIAGTITRNFPRMLREAFTNDLSSGNDGFAEIVFRSLIAITKVVGRTENETNLYSAAIERLEIYNSNVTYAAHLLNTELKDKTAVLVFKLTSVRRSMEAGFSKILQGQAEIKNAVSTILDVMKKGEIQRSYMSAI